MTKVPRKTVKLVRKLSQKNELILKALSVFIQNIQVRFLNTECEFLTVVLEIPLFVNQPFFHNNHDSGIFTFYRSFFKKNKISWDDVLYALDFHSFIIAQAKYSGIIDGFKFSLFWIFFRSCLKVIKLRKFWKISSAYWKMLAVWFGCW